MPGWAQHYSCCAVPARRARVPVRPVNSIVSYQPESCLVPAHQARPVWAALHTRCLFARSRRGHPLQQDPLTGVRICQHLVVAAASISRCRRGRRRPCAPLTYSCPARTPPSSPPLGSGRIHSPTSKYDRIWLLPLRNPGAPRSSSSPSQPPQSRSRLSSSSYATTRDSTT